MKTCPECQIEFEPKRSWQEYCSVPHRQKALDRRRNGESASDQVVAVRGRSCTNCRSDKPGKRWAFWWDDFDESDLVTEAALILCPACWHRICKQKARESTLNETWALLIEGAAPTDH